MRMAPVPLYNSFQDVARFYNILIKFIKYFTRLGIQPHVITVDPAMATYPVIDQTLKKIF